MACKYIYKGITYSSKEEFINKVIPTLQNSTLSKFDKVPTNKQVYNASIKNYEDNIVNFEKAIQAIKDNNYKIILPNNTGRYVASVESEGIRGGTIPIAENPYTKEAKEGKFDKEYALSYLKERIEIEKGSIENENRKIKDIEKVENDVYNKNINSNNFLQLLNKDNNWITFFIKSIIQDSQKKGYEKVLFPTGNTASKVEGHTTLEEFKKQKEDRIKQIDKGFEDTIQKLKDFYLENVRYIKKDGKFFKQNAPYVKSIEIQENEFTDVINIKLQENKKSIEIEKNQIQDELKKLETEGFGALKPIYNFYENTVTNILKKQGLNPVQITDEYGNKWNEVTLNQARDLANILLQRNEANQIIGQANIKAMTVLIDAVNQRSDTIPHEYAHHYIAWFRNTPIVQEAIKKWGSEEALVQSIGEQVVKQKGEAYNWWNKFVKWIMNQFNSLSKLQKEELTQILTDAFLTRQDIKSKDAFNFNYEGFRHINWKEDNQTNGLESSSEQFSLPVRPTVEAIKHNLVLSGIVHNYRGVYRITKTSSSLNRLDVKLTLLGIDPEKAYTKEERGETTVINFNNSELEKADKIEDSKDNTKVQAIVNFLQDRFPSMEVHWLSDKEFKEVAPKSFKSVANSFVKDGKVYLNKSKITNNIAAEEMLHPFISTLVLDNPTLFSNLLNKAKQEFPALWEQIQSAYNDKRGFKESDRQQELVTQVLARYFNKEQESNTPTGLKEALSDFVAWFKDIFKNLAKFLYGDTYMVGVENLDPDTTFTDIAKIINTVDTKFNIRKDTGTKFNLNEIPELMSRDEARVQKYSRALLLQKTDGTYFTPAEQQEITRTLSTLTMLNYLKDPEQGANAILKAFGQLDAKRKTVTGKMAVNYESIYALRERIVGDTLSQLQGHGLRIDQTTRRRILNAVRNLTTLTEQEKTAIREANPELDTDTTDIYSGEFLESVGRISKDWSDNTFEIDPKDTASARIKMFLGSIFEVDTGSYFVARDGIDISNMDIASLNATQLQALALQVNRKGVWYKDEKQSEALVKTLTEKTPIVPVQNFLGLNRTADSNKLFSSLLKLLGDRSWDFSVDNAIAIMKSNNNPTLQYLAKKLALSDTSMKNEFMTVFSKQYQPFVMCLFGKNREGKMILNPVMANRFNQKNALIEAWKESQKLLPITIIDSDGNRVLDREFIRKELLPIIETARGMSWNSKESRNWFIINVGKVLNELGIGVSDEMVAALYDNPKKYTGNSSITALFGKRQDGLPTGLLSIIVEGSLNAGETLEHNNPLYTQTSLISGLAKLVGAHSPVLYSMNYRNSEGKIVYEWGLNTKLSHQFRDLVSSQEAFEEFKKKADSAAISRYNWLLATMQDSPALKDYMELAYLDGLKKNKSRKGVTRQGMSDRENLLMELMLYQNRGNGFNTESKVNHISLTHSDKKPTPVFRNIPRIDTDNKQKVQQVFYNIFRAEWERIVQQRDVDINNAAYNVGKNYFYFIPDFNFEYMQQMVKSGFLTQRELDTIWPGGKLTSIINPTEELPIINKILREAGRRIIDNTMATWAEEGITPDIFDVQYKAHIASRLGYKETSVQQNKKKTIKWFQTDGKEVSKEQVDADLLLYAAKDFALNRYAFNVSLAQLFYGDPAETWKGSVEKTFVEYNKRLAKDIAPRTDLQWKEGNRKYNIITLTDIKTIEPVFKAIAALKKHYIDDKTTATDAQEITTVQEKLDVLHSAGRIEQNVYEEMTKIVSDAKGGFYKFTDSRHLAIIMQPEKPIYAGNRTENGVLSSDYIKSSAWALYPPYTKNTELDKLRVFMEKNNIQRAVYKTAYKVGSPSNPLTVFTPEGKFIEPSNLSAVKVLDRKWFGIQQDNPYDEDKKEIGILSQMNTNIMEGVSLMDGFNIPGHGLLSGKELIALKETIRKEMVKLKSEALKEELNIDVTGNVDYELLIDKMIEKAMYDPTGSYTLNDIQSIAIRDADGTPMIPMMFNAIGDRFESMLMGMYNKVPIVKMPGHSYIQASSVGFVLSDDKDLSGIIRIGSWDGTALKPMRPDPDNPGKILPGQIILPFYFFDNNGNKLKASDFVKEGTNEIDFNKLPKELLEIIGGRIPNQSYSSIHPLEVVGFSPDNMGDFAMVPSALVKQMGSDFDVDKLYTYHRPYKYINGKLTQITKYKETLGADSEEWELLKELTRKKLEESGIEPDEDEQYDYAVFNKHLGLAVKERYPDGNVPTHRTAIPNSNSIEVLQEDYFNIHWAVLTHPDMLEKIMTPLDKDDLIQEAKLLAPDTTMQNFFDPMVQAKNFQRGKEAKRLVGATSWASKFSVRIQDKKVQYGELNDKGRIAPATIDIMDDNGNVKSLTLLSGHGTSSYQTKGEPKTAEELKESKRSKQDNHVLVQSEAVDNANKRTLDNLNVTSETYKAVQAMIQLEDENGWAASSKYWTRLLAQPIIQEFSKAMKRGNDSLSEVFGVDLYKNVTDQLRTKYIELLDPTKESGHIIPSPQLMLDMRKFEGHKFAIHQLAALELFKKLYSIGNAVLNIESLTNQDVAGAGLNLLEVLDNEREYRNINTKSAEVMNAGELFHNDDGSLTELGYIFRKTNTDALNTLTQVLPYHKLSTLFLTMEDVVQRKLSLKEQKNLLNAFRSSVFTQHQLWWKDAQQERQRLLFGKNSLAKRLVAAKESWGKDNPFLTYLRTNIATADNLPDFITYSNSSKIATIDQHIITTGWLYLLMSENEEQRRLGEDLVRYNYLTGGNNDANSFTKFMPAGWLAGTPFSAVLKDIEKAIIKSEEYDFSSFVIQFLQHNPYIAKQIPTDALGTFDSSVYDQPEAFEIPAFSNTEVANALYNQVTKEPYKFVVYKNAANDDILYMNNGNGFYVRIDTLGNQFTDEYDGMKREALRSILPENQAKVQAIPADLPTNKSINASVSNSGISHLAQLGIRPGGINEALDGLKKIANNPKVPIHIRVTAQLLLDTQISMEDKHSRALLNAMYKPFELTFRYAEDSVGDTTFLNKVNLNPYATESIEHAAEVFIHEMTHYRLQFMIFATGNDQRFKGIMPDKSAFIEGLINGYREKFPGVAKHADALDRVRYQALNAFRQQIGEEEYRFVKELVENKVGLPDDHPSLKNLKMYYALSSVQELSAHLTTDIALTEFLNNIQTAEGKTVLSKVWDILADMFIALKEALGVEVKEGSLLHEALIHSIALHDLSKTRNVDITTSIDTNAEMTVLTEQEAEKLKKLMEDSYQKTAEVINQLTNYKIKLSTRMHDVPGQRGKVLDELYKQVAEISEAINRAESPEKRIELMVRRKEVKEDIVLIHQNGNVNIISKVGVDQLKWVDKVLKATYSTPADVAIALDTVRMWENVVELLHGDVRDHSTIPKELQEVSAHAKNLRRDLYNSKALDTIKDYLQGLVTFTKKEVTEGLSDMNIIEASTLSLLRAKNAMINGITSITWREANNRDEEISKTINKLKSLKKRMEDSGLAPEKLLDNVNEQWGLVERFSAIWHSTLNQLLQHRNLRLETLSKLPDNNSDKVKDMKKMEWVRYWKEVLSAGTLVDISAMLSIETGEIVPGDKFDAAFKKLSDNVGGDEFAMDLVKQAQAKFKEYLVQKEAIYQYYESVTTLTDEEAQGLSEDEKKVKLENKVQGILNKWIVYNSPMELLHKVNNRKWSNIVSEADRYLVIVPKKVNTKYWNENFAAIENNKTHLALYNEYKKLLKEMISYLPINVQAQLPENFLPIVPNDTAFSLANLMNKVKNWDTELLKAFTATDWEEHLRQAPDKIPVLYTKARGNLKEQKNRSKDPIRMLELFSMMALHHKYLAPTIDAINLVEGVIAKVNADRANGISEGEQIRNLADALKYFKDMVVFKKPTELQGKIGKPVHSLNFKKRAKIKKLIAEKEQLKVVIYNKIAEGDWDHDAESERIEAINKEVEKLADEPRSIFTSKFSDLLLKINQMKALALNPFSAVSNFTFGMVSVHVHANGIVDYDRKSLRKAIAIMTHSVKKYWMFNETGDSTAQKIHVLMQRSGIMGDVVETEYGKSNIDGKNPIKNALNLYNWQRSGDYFAKGSFMVAMMLKKQIEVTEKATGNKRTISLWDALDENGEIKAEFEPMPKWASNNVKEQTEWNKYRDKMRKVGIIVFGNQDKNSALLLRKSWLGRLVGQFRITWLPEGIATRFKAKYFDPVLERDVKGRWLTYKDLGLFGSIGVVVKQMLSAMPGVKINPFTGRTLSDGTNLTDSEVDMENMRKNFAGLAWTAGVLAFMILVKGLSNDDDDDEKWMYQLAYNLATRSYQDLMLYSSPSVFNTVTGNFIPATKVITDYWAVVQYLTTLLLTDEKHEKDALERLIHKITRAGLPHPAFTLYPKVETMLTRDLDKLQR